MVASGSSPHGGQSGEGARSPPAARAHGRSAAARPRRPAAAAAAAAAQPVSAGPLPRVARGLRWWKLRHTGVGQPDGEGNGESFGRGLRSVSEPDLSGAGA